MLKIIKRDGSYVDFDKTKIINAINNAFIEVDGQLYEDDTAKDIADEIMEYAVCSMSKQLSVEEIQDLVEYYLMRSERKDVAKAYIQYRYKKEITRDTTNLFDGILDLVDGNNEELKVENSNKNASIASTQRDYMAGEVSKHLVNNYFLPEDIMQAHKEGIIHFHDADYFAQRIYNCCVWNLKDMLQNGTVINNALIEKPHSFSVACNIATQIMAQVASSQYGGQTFSLAHLAPFVDVSRQKIIAELLDELDGVEIEADKFKEIVEKRVKKEINKGIQTLQYQINTLQTTNG